MHPAPVPESVTPSHFLLPSMDVTWTGKDGSQIPGWWIPGPKGSLVVILVPGYGMGRSDLLSLAMAVRGVGFNVLLYDTRGCGAVPRGACTFGLRESDDMVAALDYVRTRPGVLSGPVGIWGGDLSGRAALETAILRPDVGAIAVDSAFDSVEDFMNLRLREDFGLDSRFVQIGCLETFRLFSLLSSTPAGAHLRVDRLGNRNILFIKGENRRELGYMSTAICNRILPRKEMLTVPVSKVRMMDGEDAKSYDRQVANFFQLNLR